MRSRARGHADLDETPFPPPIGRKRRRWARGQRQQEPALGQAFDGCCARLGRGDLVGIALHDDLRPRLLRPCTACCRERAQRSERATHDGRTEPLGELLQCRSRRRARTFEHEVDDRDRGEGNARIGERA